MKLLKVSNSYKDGNATLLICDRFRRSGNLRFDSQKEIIVVKCWGWNRYWGVHMIIN